MSYSPTQTSSDFISYWQGKLDQRRPVIDPASRQLITDAQLDDVMAAAHRVNVALARPEAPDIPDYPDVATFHVTPVADPIHPDLQFYHLELKDIHDNVRDLGYVPDVKDPGNAYADGSVVVANVRRLWDNHRLITGEPLANFLNENINFTMHLEKSMEYWFVNGSNVIDFQKLASFATEASDLAVGLPP